MGYFISFLKDIVLKYFNACLRAVAQTVKNLPAMRETWVWSLGWEDPLEEGMATHSSILAWRILMHRGAWRAAVHGVAKSRALLSDWACMQAWSGLLWKESTWHTSWHVVGTQHVRYCFYWLCSFLLLPERCSWILCKLTETVTSVLRPFWSCPLCFATWKLQTPVVISKTVLQIFFS